MKYHDRKIKRKLNLNIGDKVLLYDAAKAKQWSEKLEEKWKGLLSTTNYSTDLINLKISKEISLKSQ